MKRIQIGQLAAEHTDEAGNIKVDNLFILCSVDSRAIQLIKLRTIWTEEKKITYSYTVDAGYTSYESYIGYWGRDDQEIVVFDSFDEILDMMLRGAAEDFRMTSDERKSACLLHPNVLHLESQDARRNRIARENELAAQMEKEKQICQPDTPTEIVEDSDDWEDEEDDA